MIHKLLLEIHEETLDKTTKVVHKWGGKCRIHPCIRRTFCPHREPKVGVRLVLVHGYEITKFLM